MPQCKNKVPVCSVAWFTTRQLGQDNKEFCSTCSATNKAKNNSTNKIAKDQYLDKHCKFPAVENQFLFPKCAYMYSFTICNHPVQMMTSSNQERRNRPLIMDSILGLMGGISLLSSEKRTC